MIRRRAFLHFATYLTLSVSIGGIKIGHAQEGDVVEEMISTRPWTDFSIYTNLSRLSAALIDLRSVYNGPNGYEQDPNFAYESFNYWSNTFAAEDSFKWDSTSTDIITKLDGGLADQLRAEMYAKLSDNGEIFVNWLSSIGIERGSRLQIDFLRAQAMTAVIAATLVGDGQLSTFSNLTWIYPFC